jgi:hypothetical protein
MGTGKALLKVCPWFLLLPDKFLKSVLENKKKKKKKREEIQGIWKLKCTSIFHRSVRRVTKNICLI